MHLGFALVAWGIASNIVAGAVGLLLATIVYSIERRRPPIRTKWIAVAGLFPLAAILYVWASFTVYAVWCEVVRHVDIVIVDDQRVPLDNGYELVLIPPIEQRFVFKPGGELLHRDLTRIGSTSGLVAGEDRRGHFILHLQTGETERFRGALELQMRLASLGTSVELLTPEAFYRRARWRFSDVVAGAFILLPPIVAFSLFWSRFLRSRESSQEKQTVTAAGTRG